MMNKSQLALYFIMGSKDAQVPLITLENALEQGITMFQFREKGAHAYHGQRYYDFALKCHKLCQSFKIPFIVNDDVDLALNLKADGLHVGTTDMPLIELKKIIPANMILGYSVHDVQDLELAVDEQVDYVGIGPVFNTKSKLDAKMPIGLSSLALSKRMAPNLPMVAIGGINTDNYQAVLKTGVDGIAVISEICSNPSFIKEYRQYYFQYEPK